ncbi:hypothetical protein FB451DRAFT_442083 [Mycena latifolia]|nr:hypothetical protein FB451DRAFT_442083 [Mycena latifolia]
MSPNSFRVSVAGLGSQGHLIIFVIFLFASTLGLRTLEAHCHWPFAAWTICRWNLWASSSTTWRPTTGLQSSDVGSSAEPGLHSSRCHLFGAVSLDNRNRNTFFDAVKTSFYPISSLIGGMDIAELKDSVPRLGWLDDLRNWAHVQG